MASAGTVHSSSDYSANNDRFNKEAADWDSNPFVHAMSDKAFQAITENASVVFSHDDKPDILEIGCGTGLLTLKTAPMANEMVAVDAATAMIVVLKSKLSEPSAPKNVTPLALLLDDAEDASLPPSDRSNPSGKRLKFDLITSHLVLHHIPSIPPVLDTMFSCLKSGGMIALTDFEDFGPEAKRFHPKSKLLGVHRHGIQIDWMEAAMREAGFVDVTVKVAWRHMKRVEEWDGQFDQDKKAKGEQMEFSYVICLGWKP